LIFHTVIPTDLLHLSQATRIKNFKVFLIYFPKCPKKSVINRYWLNCLTLYSPVVTLSTTKFNIKNQTFAYRVYFCIMNESMENSRYSYVPLID